MWQSVCEVTSMWEVRKREAALTTWKHIWQGGSFNNPDTQEKSQSTRKGALTDSSQKMELAADYKGNGLFPLPDEEEEIK